LQTTANFTHRLKQRLPFSSALRHNLMEVIVARRHGESPAVGRSVIKIGKAVLYPSDELDRWDRSNVVLCHRTKDLPFDDDAESDGRCVSG
jgi:hypothetical protein